MVQQITLTRTDVGVSQGLVNLKWLGLDPLSILIIESFLGNFSDVDFWVEVRCEGMMMITCVTIDDVEIMNLVEMMLGGIGRIYTTDTWVEPAA